MSRACQEVGTDREGPVVRFIPAACAETVTHRSKRATVLPLGIRFGHERTHETRAKVARAVVVVETTQGDSPWTGLQNNRFDRLGAPTERGSHLDCSFRHS
jgi:hypothetical protein